MRKELLYYTLQVCGWLTYVILAGILNEVKGNSVDASMFATLVLVFLLGTGLTHLYRLAIIRLNWNKLGLFRLLPRVVASGVLFAVIFELIFSSGVSLINGSHFDTSWINHLGDMLNWFILFFVWSLLYFSFQFFMRYRAEEIKNLKLEATKREIELNKLKSQLNPHFIFNSMNTIRALIEEDPEKAKQSVTQLSNIMRYTLVMSTQRTVPFDEEMKVVKDYLALEKVRYEERLDYKCTIEGDASKFSVPSLMIQTLVENSIKHGIATLPKGGLIRLEGVVNNGFLTITIKNPGILKTSSGNGGYGLINTRQRLNLIYGEKASFRIEQLDNEVITTIKIPKENVKSNKMSDH